MPEARILFLCTGNSCRSQMAEGWARHFHGDRYAVASAGIERHGMNPWAVRVMAEAGVDLAGHSSKTLEDLDDPTFDWVITVCASAHDTCPVFPGEARILHHGFDDPPGLARGLTDEADILAIYRRVRDQIRDFARTLPTVLQG